MTLFEHFEKMHEPTYACNFIKNLSDKLIHYVPHSKISFTEGENNDFSLNVDGDLFSQVNGKLKTLSFNFFHFNTKPDKFLKKLDEALETHLFQCNSFMKETLPAMYKYGLPFEKLCKAQTQWKSVPNDISKVCEALWDQPHIIKTKMYDCVGRIEIAEFMTGVTAFIEAGGQNFMLSDNGFNCTVETSTRQTYSMFASVTHNILVKYPELVRKFDSSVDCTAVEEVLSEPVASSITTTPIPIEEFTL